MNQFTGFRPALPEWVEQDKRIQSELLNQLHINDVNEQAVFQSIIDYAKKYNTAKIPIQSLYQQVQTFAQQNDYKSLKVNVNAINAIQSVCQTLRKKGFCELQKNDENEISALILEEQDAIDPEELESIVENLKNIYHKIDSEIPKSFPSPEILPQISFSSKTLMEIPLESLSPSNAENPPFQSPLIKILMPQEKDILIPTDTLPNLHTKTLNLLKYYLMRPDIKSSPLLVKIKKHFPNLSRIKTSSELIKDSFQNAQYWVTLAEEIIEIAKEKKESLFIQASLLIKYYWIQKNKEEQALKNKMQSMEKLLKILEKTAHPTKKSALLELYHQSNSFQRYQQHEFLKIVEEFIQTYTYSEAMDVSPLLFSIEGPQETLYIHRSHLINLMDQKMQALGLALKEKFKLDWREDLLNFEENKEMQEPLFFEKAISNYIQSNAPFYYGLLKNPPLFYNVFAEISKKNPSVMKRAGLYFNHLNQKGLLPTLKPFAEILGLDREILLKEVKKSLPFSYRFPLIRFLLSFWHQLITRKSKAFSNIKKTQKKADSPKKQKFDDFPNQNKKELSEIRKELKQARKRILGNQSFKAAMEEYESRWNRSLSEYAKEDNRRLIRDLLHSRLRYFHSPSIQKIEQEVEDMLASEALLQKISDQEAIRHYLTAYMVEYLNKKYK